jgi:putative transposase
MSAPRPADTRDLTDDEWPLLAPLLPPAKSGGRPRQYAMREVIEALPSILRAGGAWRLMPHERPHGHTA